MKIVFSVGDTTSQPIDIDINYLSDCVSVLEGIFPGKWKMVSVSEEIDPPVEEVEPADPEDYDDSIVSSFIRDSESEDF